MNQYKINNIFSKDDLELILYHILIKDLAKIIKTAIR